MAPMGALSNYERRANAILLLDRSLSEVRPGIYEVSQTFPHQGIFNVMFKVASRGVEYRNLPFTEVTVVEETKTNVKTNEK